MSSHPNPTPELILPIASLHALRSSLEAELGVDAAARALQRAGHAAGDALFARLEAASGDLAELGESEFWQRLHALFAERGWGELHFEAVHAGIGSLESSDWAEADPDQHAGQPACHFTAGLLANLLGRTANERVGALEVECRSRGDLRCRFFFGGEAALDRLYQALCAGRDVEEALGELV